MQLQSKAAATHGEVFRAAGALCSFYLCDTGVGFSFLNEMSASPALIHSGDMDVIELKSIWRAVFWRCLPTLAIIQ